MVLKNEKMSVFLNEEKNLYWWVHPFSLVLIVHDIEVLHFQMIFSSLDSYHCFLSVLPGVFCQKRLEIAFFPPGSGGIIGFLAKSMEP